METYRLKNIVIVILLLLNAFLLLLVCSRSLAERRAEQALIDQTVLFLQGSGVSIDETLLSDSEEAFTCSYERSAEEEIAFAEALLGAAQEQEDAGGGTWRYTFSGGSATFRSNGAFQLSADVPSLAVEDPEAFVQDYCPENYVFTSAQSTDLRTLITAAPYLDGKPIYSAAIEFVLQDGLLASASGFFIPGSGGVSTDAQAIGRCSAVVSLVDDCNQAGRVCNSITAISPGFVLQSTASAPLLLSPVYRIDTNTYSYYIDAVTGRVSVAR